MVDKKGHKKDKVFVFCYCESNFSAIILKKYEITVASA